jgi:nucleoside-diphosphate-sugar epimerase
MLSHINIGSGEDISIADLAALVARVVGFEGSVTCDATKPDGTPRKLMDVSKLAALGWRPRIALADGIAATYDWFLQHKAELREA